MFLFKVVYVLRNPKDQLVSMYNFMKNIPIGQIEPLKSMLFSGWDKFFDHMVAGKFCLSWAVSNALQLLRYGFSLHLL